MENEPWIIAYFEFLNGKIRGMNCGCPASSRLLLILRSFPTFTDTTNKTYGLQFQIQSNNNWPYRKQKQKSFFIRKKK